MKKVAVVVLILGMLALILGLLQEARDGKPWALALQAQAQQGTTPTPARITPMPGTPVPIPVLDHRQHLPLCEKDVNPWGWY